MVSLAYVGVSFRNINCRYFISMTIVIDISIKSVAIA